MMTSHCRIIALATTASLSLVALSVPRSVTAATLTWNGDFAQWQAPGAWDGGILSISVPGAIDTARFANAAFSNTTVFFQDARSVNSLLFENTVNYSFFTGNGASGNAGLTIGSGGVTHTSLAQSIQNIAIPTRLSANATINTATESGGITRFSSTVDLGGRQLSVVGSGLTQFLGTVSDGGSLIVGNTGTGRLMVTGTLATQDGTIGRQVGGNGAMTVDGGAWNTSGTIRVGGEGTGSLTVSGGGSVDAREISVAERSGTTGTLTVSGSSTVTTDNLRLGEDGGTATVNLQGSSLLDVAQNLDIGANALLASTGGTLRTGQLTGNGRITAISNGGVPLTIDQSGNSTFSGSIRNQSMNFGSDLTKTGAGELTLTGLFDINGVVRVNGGTLRLGNEVSGGLVVTMGNFWNVGAVVVDGKFVMQNMGALSYANGFFGTGTLELRDNTTLTLINSNPFSGTTIVGVGSSLVLGNLTETGGIGGNIVNNGFLSVTSTVIANRVNNNITGNGTLFVNSSGGGTTTFANNVTAGSLSLGQGKLIVDTGRTLTTSGFDSIGVSHDSEIVIRGAGTTWNAAFVSTGSTVAAGNITLTQGGTMTASQGVFMRSSSVLQLADGAVLTTPELDVLGRITLDNGIVGHAATISIANLTPFSVISGTIENAPERVGGFIKQGAGIMILSGNNTYTGVTDVREGIVRITGTSASSEFIVAPGATLETGGTTLTLTNRQTIRGGGTLIGNFNNAGGILAPGMSPGTLTLIGNYVQGGAGVMNIEIASLSSFDRLLVSGNAILGGTLNVSFLPGFVSPSVLPYGFDFMTVDGTATGFFNRINVVGLPAQTSYRVETVQTGTGNTGYRVSFVVIPEANTGLLALLASPGLLLLTRRKRI